MKGIVGGGLIDAPYNAALAEMDVRARLIVETVKNNLLATMYEVSEPAVLSVFEKLLPIGEDLVKAVDEGLEISGVPNNASFAKSLAFEIEQKENLARAELRLFASAPRRADAQGITVYGDAGYIQANGTSSVVQNLSASNHALDGALHQVLGFLSVIERRLDAAQNGGRALRKMDVAALEPLFVVAYSLDVSAALKAAGLDHGKLYESVTRIQTGCTELAAVQAEFEELADLVKRGHFRQTGPDRAEAFKTRWNALAADIREAIDQARATLQPDASPLDEN